MGTRATRRVGIVVQIPADSKVLKARKAGGRWSFHWFMEITKGSMLERTLLVE